ncbi:S-layer homology domain-containing protein [Acetoanaerobium sticklandii]|uniref:S-layer homology domain-containing protein n=1 Tax=Acetoanaerobium sticklandii TaxID=1511 RepID=UPI003A8D5F61
MKTSQVKTNKKKKVLSMLLALTMIFQISIPAVFAENEENQKKIIAFEELADDVKNITVEVDSTEAELVAKMPSSLNATYLETTTGSALSITLENITWEIDEANSDSAPFDSSQNGASYTYKAKLPATDSTGDELVLESGVSLPTITVLVGAVPILLGGDLDEASITEQGGNITTYATIEEAITVAQTVENCTVTLLKDVETENLIIINKGTFALDLNGKWLNNTYSDGIMAIGLQGDSSNTVSLKIKDNVGTGSISTVSTFSIYSLEYCSLKIEGGSYKGIMWSWNNVGDALENGYVYRNISDNSLVTDVNTLSNFEIYNVKVTPAPVIITAQPEDAIIALGYTVDQAPTFTVTAQTVPTDSGQTISYQWYKDDVVIDGATNSSYTVPTGLTEGTYYYYCAVTCEGVLVKSNNAELYIYSNTGDYEVTDSNSNTSKYPALEAAITFAKSKPGSTVKLLADATTSNKVEIGSGTFTIDLNGHIWTSTATDRALVVSHANHITLKDSHGGGKFTTSTAEYLVVVSRSSLTIDSGIYENTVGTVLFAIAIDNTPKVIINDGSFIGTATGQRLFEFYKIGVLINNGSFSGNPVYFGDYENIAQSVFLAGGTYDRIITLSGSVGTLLEEDYAFNQSGTWINNPSGTDISNVIVQLKPVAISQQPQNATNATYGYTQGPNISVTAQKAATGTGDISYKWYRVKSGSEIADMEEGANSNTLEIQPGLPAGTHSFYCVVSCDGYMLNSETVTFTVEKATPTIKLEVFTREEAPFDYGENVYLQAWVTGVGTGENAEKPDGTVTFRIDDEVVATSDFNEMWKYYAFGEGKVFDVGSHSFTAVYNPSTDGTGKNYVSVTSAPVEQAISQAPQASLHINEVTGKKFLEGSFTLGTTGGTGTGAVSYSASSNDVLSISGNTATITGAGTVIVTAIKAEDENYLSATAETVITIDKAPAPTLTFPTASGITYGQKLLDSILDGGSITLGSFSWRESEKDLVPTVNGGINIARVIFTPNATTVKNYEEISQVDKEEDIIFSVSKAQPSINLSTRSTGVSGNRNTEITINLSKSGFGYYPQGTVKLVDCTEATEKDVVGAENIPLLNGKTSYNWTGLSDKTYKVKAIYLGDENYLPASSSISEFDTTKNEQENFKLSNPGSKTYGDNAFTLTTSGGNGTGAVSYVSSDESIISISGDTATIHKAGTVSITATKAGDDNYNPAMNTLAVDVAKKALNIKADDKLNVVKGSTMPTLTYKVNGLVGTDSLTKEPVITTSATDTNAIGEYVILISEAEVSNSDSYEISYTNGKMTVINSGSGDNGNNGNNGDSGNNSGNSSSGGSSSKDNKDDKEPTKAPANQTPTQPAQAELPLQTSEQNSTNAPVFADTENHWAKSDIEFVISRGLFSGTGDGKFSPNMPMTRGMFVTVLGKLAKADLTGFDSTDFKDVKSDAYYLPYIQWANTSGIVNGISSEEFAPDMPISREQMAVMLLNYIKAINIDLAKLNEENQFADTDEMSTWAKEAVKAIQMSGILSGKPDNKFDPKGIATRAEVSSMLRRFIELMEESAK